jgi:CheY-specific phosphatase CheX
MSPTHAKPDLDKIGGQALREVLHALLGFSPGEIQSVDEAASEAPLEPASEVDARLPSSAEFRGARSPFPARAREDTRATGTRKSRSPEHAGAAKTTPQEHLLGIVKLTGQRVSGVVGLRVPRRFAEQAVLRLVGKDHPRPTGDTGAADFAAELCNMLAGRVATRLRLQGYPCVLDIPEVIRGCHDLPKPEAGADGSRTIWSCQRHRLTLEMQFRYWGT